MFQFQEVIAKLLTRFPNATIGQTCQQPNQYFKCANGLHFRTCRHIATHPNYNAVEYIAREPKGGIWYIGYSPISQIITCGPKGFHYNIRTYNLPCI